MRPPGVHRNVTTSWAVRTQTRGRGCGPGMAVGGVGTLPSGTRAAERPCGRDDLVGRRGVGRVAFNSSSLPGQEGGRKGAGGGSAKLAAGEDGGHEGRPWTPAGGHGRRDTPPSWTPTYLVTADIAWAWPRCRRCRQGQQGGCGALDRGGAAEWSAAKATTGAHPRSRLTPRGRGAGSPAFTEARTAPRTRLWGGLISRQYSTILAFLIPEKSTFTTQPTAGMGIFY